MKQKLFSKRLFLMMMLCSSLSFLLPLIPMLYSMTGMMIQPINGYQCLVFLSDRENLFLYLFSLCLLFLLVSEGLAFLFSFVALFLPKEREKTEKRFALFFLVVSFLASVLMLIFSYFLKDSNLYANLGVWMVMVCLMLTVIFAFLLDWKLKKKEQK